MKNYILKHSPIGWGSSSCTLDAGIYPQTHEEETLKKICISKWCKYINMKAQLNFAGNEQVGCLSYIYLKILNEEILSNTSPFILLRELTLLPD